MTDGFNQELMLRSLERIYGVSFVHLCSILVESVR